MGVSRNITLGCGALGLIGSGVVLLDFSRKRKAESHTVGSAFKHYASLQLLRLLGWYMYRKLEKDIEACLAVQEETLMQQIRINMNTEYGRDFKFESIKSSADFIKSHPLTTYSHYASYVRRMMEGEENVLTSGTPMIFGVTSGTSGNPSVLPTVKKHVVAFFTYGIAVLYHIMICNFPGFLDLQRDMKFFYTPKSRSTSSGIPIGPNSSNPQNSQSVWNLYSTPPEAYQIMSEPEARYIYLLFGLKDKNLGIIEANFASLVYAAFQTLEEKWPQLVQDIEEGNIDPDLKIDENMRKELLTKLQPDPQRAKELKDEFEKGLDGVAKRIWPHLNFVLTVATGSFELYGKLLRDKYCRNIPIYSPLYGATEGLIGLNLWPRQEKAEFLLVPRVMFFEFIPIENMEEAQPETLLIDQVEEGSSYELVITNLSCLYRYRVGDVVTVTGFHKGCPKVQFCYRKGQFLNIRGEKTSEVALYRSLMKASRSWTSSQVVDYCCVPSPLLQQSSLNIRESFRELGGSPSYILFIELETDEMLTEENKIQVDDCLCKESFVYRSFRQKGSLGPVQVHVVSRGSFAGLKQHMMESTSVSVNQFKVPRVLSNPEAVEYMVSKTLM